MSPNRDPEGTEVRTLIATGQVPGKQVLEIGCGAGFITWQVAGMAYRIYGIDPIFPALKQAKEIKPAAINNAWLAQALGQALPYPAGIFDLAVLSSSL